MFSKPILLSLVALMILFGASAANAGELGHWKLDEGAGTTVSDSSGAGSDGTIFNPDGGLGVGGSVWDTDGDYGIVLSFNGVDGTGAYVDAGMIPALGLTTDFSWAFWAKQDGDGGGVNKTMLGNRYGASDQLQFSKFTPTNFEFYNNGDAGFINYDDLPDGVWLHHVVVKDGAALTYYRNGVQSGSSTATATLVTQPLTFGGDVTGVEQWRGWLHDVHIYDHALSQSEINALASISWATNPSPADGTNAGPGYNPPNVYMMLDYAPGAGAVTHTAYFSDVEQDVIDRKAGKSLGSTPPWPSVDDNAFVVGFDYEAIPEYARAPLVAGKTYYWCIDEFDGTDTWPGNVWSFTVMPPYAWGPDPADGAELVPTDTTLSWNLGDIETDGFLVTYRLYVGTDEAAIEAIVTANTTAPEYMGTVEPTSFDITDLDPETELFWRVDTRRQQSLPPFPLFYTKGDVWSFTTAPEGVGHILREWWIDITGAAITDLTNDPNYPDNPDGSELVGLFEGPTDVMDNYGSRLHGWLYVQNTGDYTFWIASDNAGELWLSTDSNPGNTSLIAYVTGWVASRDFDDIRSGNVGGPGMQSAPIHLKGGELYYISGLMKEEAGGDNIAVAWRGPDSGGVREVIPGNHLKPYVPVIAQNPDPADGSADAPLDVTLGWTAGLDESTKSPYTTQHVYLGSDPVAVANATTASPEYMGGPTGPNEYGPLSLSYYENVYWRVDGVVADTGTVLYRGSVWTFKAAHDPGQVCDTNLRLWLRFEDNALDSSGYGRDGTEMGGPTYVDGQDAKAIHFDGVDDYVEIEYEVGISGDDARTIAGWTKADTTVISDWANVFGFCPGWEGNYQYFDIEKIGGGNQYGIHIHGEQWGLLDVDLEWHHIAVAYQPGSAAAYVDGALLIALDTTGVALSTVDKVRMGYRPSQNAYFPGSVDDVRIYDVAKDAAAIEEIMRIELAWAWTPEPRHGATDVPRDQILRWWHGDGTTMSTVYFGKDDPANMVLVAGPQAATTYDPGTLDLGTTYYWQIFENSSKAKTPCSPSFEPFVWKFTVSNYLVVDDMESYTPWTTPGNNIFETWLDGFGDCAGSGNDTGAVLTENADPVLGGVQSMKYDFDNDGTVFSPCDSAQVGGRLKYSKIEVQTSDLVSGIGSDWTIGGVKALSVPFYGTAGNATTESLWVQLQDGAKGYGEKVFYGDYEGESLDDFNEASWHDWYIDLADFGVELDNVVSITIGIGDESKDTAFGSGTLYFDEIRLYTPSCRPDRAKPAADFDNSCKVDYPDVAALFDAWLLQDLEETVWSGGAWTSTDIGDVDVPGSFTDLGGGAYTITGRGADIWGTDDAFLYAYKPLSGDGQMTVRVTGIGGPSVNDWRKAGIMIRETLDPSSSHAFMAITPAGGGGSSFQSRPTTGSASNNQDGPAGVTMPQCIRLLRVGDQFRAFRYVNGEWAQAGGPVTVPMAEDVLIGLAVTSHEATTSCTATFDRVCSEDFIEIDLVEDSVINFEDYAELMNQWMDKVFWP